MKNGRVRKTAVSRTSVVFVVDSFIIGGHSSSILSLLRLADTSALDVTLVYFFADQIILDKVPSSVRLICMRQSGLHRRIIRFIKKRIATRLAKMPFFTSKTSNYMSMVQRASLKIAKRIRAIEEEYDVAIAGMEVLSTYYVAEKVKARRKIAWIHTNYIDAKLDARIDDRFYSTYDMIVTVSSECKEAFDLSFPQHADKSVIIRNTIDDLFIREQSNEQITDMQVSPGTLCIVTVARIDNKSKRFDRIIDACNYLNGKGFQYKWYIIGDGNDRRFVESGITKYSLQNHLILLGQKSNPYPYIKRADLFVLLSIYEGRPITINESHLLGCPTIVTDYASAREQVPKAYGEVIDNDNQTISQNLYNTICQRGLIETWKTNLEHYHIDNSESIKRFQELCNIEDST